MSKSCYCSVEAPSPCVYAELMKNSVITQNKERSFRFRRLLLRRANAAHDPWPVLKLELFNLAGGWNQQQAQQFNR